MNLIKAFFSDPHFGHSNIIKYCNRPFNNVEEMNRTMIEKYNSIIGKDDTAFWLGDCFFKDNEVAKQIMQQLNGYKLLIVGNHDRSPQVMSSLGFSLVMEEGFMTIAGRQCRLKHYPYLEAEPPECRKDDRYKDRRPPKIKGEILFHGHNHAKYKRYNNMIHVGVDGWEYGPAPMFEIEKLVLEV